MGIKVNVFIGGAKDENVLCSGAYEVTLSGVEVSDRVIGPKGKESGLSEYDVNLVIEAALSDKFFDIASTALNLQVSDYTVADIANENVSAEEVGYSAELLN